MNIALRRFLHNHGNSARVFILMPLTKYANLVLLAFINRQYNYDNVQYFFLVIHDDKGGGPGAVVKTACLESRKEIRKDSILWGASVTERWCAQPRGQCQLIHLPILSRFSWTSLALMYTKVT